MLPAILIVNAGSSSLKFALFRADGEDPQKLLSGNFQRTPSSGSRHAVPALVEQVERRGDVEVVAVGHRIVHGGERYSAPQILDDDVLRELAELVELSPEHMPSALSLVAELRKIYGAVPHVACFDTAFHHDLPAVAARLPIPRRYAQLGLRRYGFHGISYAYLLDELARVAGAELAAGRIVLAHLGHGASLAAVHGGRSIDTTMALTPASGLVMSTRSGDLDPGILPHLARREGLSVERFWQMVHKESGMLGISETTGDVRELLTAAADDPRAEDALASFCYHVKKSIGALAAALGGIDALIFSGGIGENAAPVRARICDGLAFLGLEIDAAHNQSHAQLISDASSRVPVFVLHTDEELYIARAVLAILARDVRHAR